MLRAVEEAQGVVEKRLKFSLEELGEDVLEKMGFEQDLRVRTADTCCVFIRAVT